MIRWILLLSVALVAGPAFAQTQYPSPFRRTPAGHWNAADSTGNLGINQPTVVGQLDIVAAASSIGVIVKGAAATDIVNVKLSDDTEVVTVLGGGNVGISQTTPAALLDLGPSTSAAASLRVGTGVIPSTPAAGDIYSDGTDLFFYDGTAWRDLTQQDTDTDTQNDLDGAYDDGATVTVDAADILLNLNDATNDYKLVVDNATTGEIAAGIVLQTTGVGGTIVDGLDLSDAGITNAIDIGANNIATAAATIASTELDRLDGVTGALYFAGGTDVAIGDGGTGASLADPGADRVLFWDETANAVTWLTMGTNLTITGTTLDATGGGNTLDQAYDQGGAGAGAAVTVDSGAVALTTPNTSNNVVLSAIQNDTTNNPDAVTIQNTGTGDGLFLNQDGNGIPLSIDSEATTTAALDITHQGDGVTNSDMAISVTAESGNGGLYITRNQGAATTDNRLVFFSEAGASDVDVLEIKNAGTGRAAFVNQDGEGIALEVDTEAATSHGIYANNATQTTGNVFYLRNANNLTTGSLIEATSNSADTGTRELIFVHNDHASATGAEVAQFRQDAAENNVSINTDGNGRSIYIDTEATTADAIDLDVVPSTTGDGIQISVDTDNQTTGKAIRVRGTSTGTTDVFTVDANGIVGGRNGTLTLGVGVTTFALTSNVMTITGDGGGNTIATITGASPGLYTLIFVDANVTITDTASGANTANLSAAFTSADNTVLQLVFDGTSFFEVSRSTN